MVEEHGNRSDRSGERSPSWKGGRTVDPRGYVLIHVGKGHPLADVRGYAYEHRLIAQEMVDHPLTSQEHVHHDNEQKGDNRPDNLIPTASPAHHRLHHRTVGFNRRLPDEENVEVSCQCGCGTTFLRYDSLGRPREYVSGHNPNEAETQDALYDAVVEGRNTLKALREAFPEKTKGAIGLAIDKLCKKGRLVRRDHGVYGLPGSAPLRQQETIACACGCGATLDKYDSSKRERRFLPGHQFKKWRQR